MATFRTLLAGTRLLRTVMVGLMSLSSAGLVLADEVQVAVAANFTAPFQQIAQAFTQSTGHTVRVSGASTGKLLLQIQNARHSRCCCRPTQPRRRSPTAHREAETAKAHRG